MTVSEFGDYAIREHLKPGTYWVILRDSTVQRFTLRVDGTVYTFTYSKPIANYTMMEYKG